MSTIIDLFRNKWLTVSEKTMDNGGKYVYSRSLWCNSEGVAILPYMRIKNDWNFNTFLFLGRYEVCPAHSDAIELCSITGGMDKEGESPVFTAVRELIEEGGYEVKPEEMVYLGSVRPSKASDSTNHLFAVDITDALKVEAIGDGTLGEEGAFCDWISEIDLINAKDPLLHSMYGRAKAKGLFR